MCGFVATLSLCSSGRGDSDSASLRAATRLLRHRGPDDEAFYVSPEFSAGFRRLKIIDLSDNARQPMCDASGRYWIVFNGEIYNYREVREELAGLGRTFRTESDTEVLLQAFLQWGTDCVPRLNGMFAFLVWDEVAGELFGARDRFGEKPLFYAVTPAAIHFASEIKALFPLLDDVPAGHPGVIRRYLDAGQVDFGPQTFYQGIVSLPPAHSFRVRDGQMSLSRYWQLTPGETACADPAARFRELFLDSMQLRIRSDVPLGTCLSGGLDSGAIVCSLSTLLEQPHEQVTRKTFTAAYPQFDESEQVAAVNSQSGSIGHSIIPQPGRLDDLAEMLRFHDEPFHSYAAFASYQVMRLAKQNGVTVLLNGQGADETLAGYHSYLSGYLHGLLLRGQLLRACRAARGATALTGKSAGRSLLEGVDYWSSDLLRRVGPIRSLREKFRRPDELAQRCCLTPDFAAAFPGQLPAYNDPSLRFSPLKQRLYQSTTAGTLPLYLRVEDRNSMAHSIESRLPFLDHRLVEFAFSVPSHRLMENGQNKAILREAMRGLLPDVVLQRKKKFGFPVPEVDWIYGSLREQIREMIHSPELSASGLFDGESLARRYARECDRYEAGEGNLQRQRGFWFRVVSIGLWEKGRRQFRVRGDGADSEMRIVNGATESAGGGR